MNTRSIGILIAVAVIICTGERLFDGGTAADGLTPRAAAAQSAIAGGWVIDLSDGDKVRLRMHRREDQSVTARVSLSQLQGLQQSQIDTNASQVDFRLVRDAGIFTLTGSFRGGRGTGTWTFTSDPAYTDELQKQGYGQVTQDDLCVLGLSDVRAAYIRAVAAAGYRRLTVGQVVALSTNDVSADYIAGLGSAGFKELEPNELLSLRTNGVTAIDADTLGTLVAGRLSAVQLVALKTNGVTETYIRSIQDAGYKQLSAKQLLALRTNGVTREVIDGLRSRGHAALTVEDIIRLHNGSAGR